MVEAVEQVLPEVDGNAEDVADSLDLEQGTPQSLAVVLGKVAVVSGRTRGCGFMVHRSGAMLFLMLLCSVTPSLRAPWHVDRPFRACTSNQEGADL